MALERIDYTDGTVTLTGWLARPAGPPNGAIVVFPTIMNVNAPMERRADMLAQAGFVTLIADFYGTAVSDFAHAVTLAAALRGDVDGYRRRIGAAVSALRALAGDLTLSAVGYCMGGQAVLEAARSGENLALVASFHGILSTDRPATAQTPITPRILISHGDADPLVPRAQVLAFWEEMDAACANWHFHSYAGVKHGFTDPGSDARGLPAIGYDASADRQSWAALTGLLDEIYG
ncbi:dienelactone hydrolase family protein [Novosphingobium sp.]|uniref:dienelactone hydrolase family protein n=1 Tax=Novosphingobium sp. TaxID=1874826 RepID=UPI00333FB260